MSEIVLTITILALLGYIAVSQYINIKEREKLMKLLMARNLTEVTENEIVEKIHEEKNTETPPPDVSEVMPEDDILFDKHIEEQLHVNPKD